MPIVEVLQASIDPADQSEFRILVDRKHIKYINIDPGLYDVPDMCFGPSLISLLPPLPPGDWNTGHISKDTATGRPRFIRHEKIQLAWITNVWHPLLIDHSERHME